MSTFIFQANPAHTRNIRRACTERHAQEHSLAGVNHKPYLHHSQSSEARLDQMGKEEELHQGKHHLHLIHQQQSKSESNVPKAQSNESIVTAFTRPEAWKLTFGSNDGGFKIQSIIICSTGNLSKS
jgi:hypothetical protein